MSKLRTMERGARKCKACGRMPAKPMSAEDAAQNRSQLERMFGGERGGQLAYCYAVSTVLLTEENSKRACVCDVRSWNTAVDAWKAKGPQACWSSLGVTRDHAKRAESQRLAELAAERPLTTEEAEVLTSLAEWEKTS